MSKHTQGPWHIARFEASTVDIRDARGVTVAEVGDTSMEDEANARLIAAAPDLMSALEHLLAAAPDAWALPGAGMYEKVMDARRALDKAAGRTFEVQA